MNYPEQAIEVKFSQILKSEEFANQLCVLFEGSPIEEKNRDCVSKWLVTLLTTKLSSHFQDIQSSRRRFVTKSWAKAKETTSDDPVFI